MNLKFTIWNKFLHIKLERVFRVILHSSPLLRGARCRIVSWRDIIMDVIKADIGEPLLHKRWDMRASQPAQQLAHN